MFWFIGGGFVLTTAAFAIAFMRSQRGPKEPIVPIASAPDGVRLRVLGKVVLDGEPLRAPWTGRACVYYRLELRVFSGQARTVDTVAGACDFAVRDDSGQAQVLSEHATFDLEADIVEAAPAASLSEKSRDLIREHGWNVPEVAQVELSEAALEVGATINVVGAPTRETTLVFARDHEVIEKPRTRRFIGKRWRD
ncbi:MAG TPA: hypothetical protein VMZ53_11040 [Kofleriaceae bacterium]|nr:hypothetical protein [Kofleriaceae bacterium]